VSPAYYLPPWRVDITFRDGVPRPVHATSLARLAAAALEAAGAPSPASLGLILSDDSELASLNAAHLGQSGATDVLSFPLLPPEAFPTHPGKMRRGPSSRQFALPPGQRLHLGDIIVSIERAVAQAEGGRGGQTGDVAWTAADELRLLVTHGVLHVCGWDHADSVEERAMRALERQLLGAV
jgi:probable rRNA maturation factor